MVCAKGFVRVDNECAQEASQTQLIVGGTIGAVLVATGAAGLYLLYKNRTRARRFLLSFFKGELLLVFKTMMELWDITADGKAALFTASRDRHCQGAL